MGAAGSILCCAMRAGRSKRRAKPAQTPLPTTVHVDTPYGTAKVTVGAQAPPQRKKRVFFGTVNVEVGIFIALSLCAIHSIALGSSAQCMGKTNAGKQLILTVIVMLTVQALAFFGICAKPKKPFLLAGVITETILKLFLLLGIGWKWWDTSFAADYPKLNEFYNDYYASFGTVTAVQIVVLGYLLFVLIASLNLTLKQTKQEEEDEKKRQQAKALMPHPKPPHCQQVDKVSPPHCQQVDMVSPGGTATTVNVPPCPYEASPNVPIKSCQCCKR